MSKPTPGPWKVGQYLGQSWSWCVHMDVGDKGRGMDIIDYVCGMDAKERLANARLIAAAPDLLEVLQEYVRLFEDHCITNPSSEDKDFTGYLAELARAAIKKATGD